VYDTILIATDGSEAASGAADHALGLASRFASTVRALSVVDPDADVSEREARAATSEVADRGEAAGVEVVTAVERGRVAETVLAHGARYGADLVVAGARRPRGVERLRRSDAATAISNGASVPVLIVPASASDAEYDDVLLAVDPDDTGAADHAIAVADAYGAALHAVCVVDARANVLSRDPGRPCRRAIRTAVEHATDAGVPVESTILTGLPAAELRSHAGRIGADVLVLERRSGAIARALGAVGGDRTGRLVRSAGVPVLVTP
jgi:nucleotide-binding universal stress UspA family protein